MDKEAIQQLSDEDLYSKVKDCGIEAGPIADSTRLLYQTLLFKKLNGLSGLDDSVVAQAPSNFDEESVKAGDSRRSVSKAPSVYEDGTPPTEPIRRSTRRSVATGVTTEFGDVIEQRSTNRRHTFKRWSLDDDVAEDDSYAYNSFDGHEYSESSQTQNGRFEEEDEEEEELAEKKVESSGTSYIVLVVLLTIAALLAALYFMVLESDEYTIIEEEARELASNLAV